MTVVGPFKLILDHDREASPAIFRQYVHRKRADLHARGVAGGDPILRPALSSVMMDHRSEMADRMPEVAGLRTPPASVSRPSAEHATIRKEAS